MDLRANQVITFSKVTLPLIARHARRPAFPSALVDNFVVTNFNAGDHHVPALRLGRARWVRAAGQHDRLGNLRRGGS